MLKRYRCQCGNAVFFRNSTCLTCGTALGFDSVLGLLIPLAPSSSVFPTDSGNLDVDQPEVWQPHPNVIPENADIQYSLSQYRRCANLRTPAACNWLVNASEPANSIYCVACSLNRTIPDLEDPTHPENAVYWGKVELAKRRMLAGLMGLGIVVASKFDDPINGLAFDLVSSMPGGNPVLTGHDSGLITLNLQEADDGTRESIRTAMGEPYRTLLGHFRHEIGHYFWDRLIKNTAWLEGFRHLFGDECQDYSASLQQNYSAGPPENWWFNYVSSYASSHPWEDWAETWAHYLHMCDTLDTASSFGLTVNSRLLEFTPFSIDALYDTTDSEKASNFLTFFNEWAGLTVLLNEMSRSMGQPDFYPFVLPNTVVTKLHFVHLVILDEKNKVKNDPNSQL